MAEKTVKCLRGNIWERVWLAILNLIKFIPFFGELFWKTSEIPGVH